MLHGIGVSCTGAHVEMARLENLANNLANLRTPGFRQDLLSFMQRPPASLAHDNGPDAQDHRHNLLDLQGGGVQLAQSRVDGRQGALETTGNELDFALEGRGYFMLEHARHGRVYSRAGAFTQDKDGFLISRDGQSFVLDHEGRRLNLRELGRALGVSGARLEVSEDGSLAVSGNGGAAQTGRRLGLAEFSEQDEARLSKLGHTLLMGQGARPAQSVRVKQGALEMSTSDATLLMAEMVNVSRAFEANMKLLKLQDQTLGELINNAGQQPA